jgi:hypothetical protein
MFPGLPRNRENCRVYTVANASTRIALKGDDPDFIVLEVVNTSFDGATVALPNSAPIGKAFTFILAANPQTLPSLTTQGITIIVPPNRGDRPGPWSLKSGQEPRFIYTPNGWLTPRCTNAGSDGTSSARGIAFGNGANGNFIGIAMGDLADGNTNGVGIGAGTSGASSGVAVGVGAYGPTQGAAIGYGAIGDVNGVAIGYSANCNSMDKAVALGMYSKAQRYRELVKSADGASTTLNSFSILDWYASTANATPTEILLGGTAAQRAILLNSSAFIFKLLAVARDNVNNDCAMWELTGGIKRGANAAATALVGAITKSLIAADTAAATWDIDALADTTNGSLKLNVTGEASKTIRWNVRGDISELRF